MGDNFFYEQTVFRKTPKRYRKTPEELPTSLKFAHLNPKVAAYLKNQERESQKGDEDEFPDKHRSLLPDINAAFKNIKYQLGDDSEDEEEEHFKDLQRLYFERWKTEAVALLTEVERILRLFEASSSHPALPETLQHQLQCSFKELATEVKVVWREWQCASNKDGHLSPVKAANIADIGPISTTFSKTIKKDSELEPEANPEMVQARIVRSTKSLEKLNTKSPGINISDTDNSNNEKTGELPQICEEFSRESRSKLSVVEKGKNRLEKYRVGSQAGTFLDTAGNATVPLEKKQSGCSDAASVASYRSYKSTNPNQPTNQPYLISVIQFQLSSPICEEKGWIVKQDEPADSLKPDSDPRKTALEWATKRLQVAIKQSKEQDEQARGKGYDKPIVIRFYGDMRKDKNLPQKSAKPKSALTKDQKPRIPQYPINQEAKENKKKLLVTSHDGTSVIYYPSGKKAIVMSKSGIGREGFYTTAYAENGHTVAVFTPTGRGSVCYDSGRIRFCAMEEGGTMQEEDGSVSKKWKWPPPSAKLPVSIIIQLNEHITFRCQNQGAMHLYFSCHKEHLKFSVGTTPGATEPDPNEIIQTQTDIVLHSEYAKCISKPKKQAYAATSTIGGKGRQLHSRAQLSTQKVKNLQSNLLEDKRQPLFENENEKQLHKLKGKVRLLVDQWMEFYRLSTGMTSPRIKSGKAKKRDIMSAQSSPGGVRVPQTEATAIPEATVSRRAPSAPAGGYRAMSARTDSKKDGSEEGGQGVVKFDDNVNFIEGSERSPFSAKFRSPTPNSAKHVRRPSTTPKATNFQKYFDKTWTTPAGVCPAILRRQILGEERPQCKCSRHHVPYITDLEYDDFMIQTTERQLVVVTVISSLFPKSIPTEDMIDKIYEQRNRNRTRPCLQSRNDPFRVFKYDIATAAIDSDHTQPLLLTRHNVVPGMFLIYEVGHLLFCDHIFNGYGNARKDFHKQMMQCRRQHSMGQILPLDFRFSPLRGRHGARSAWGGEIGGAGVDRYGSPGTSIDAALIPLTKKHSSGDTASTDSQDQPSEYNYSAGLPVTRMLNLKLSQSAHQLGHQQHRNNLLSGELDRSIQIETSALQLSSNKKANYRKVESAKM